MTTDTLILGRQTFDGLGRQRSVEVAGRSTHYHYRSGQSTGPPCATPMRVLNSRDPSRMLTV